MTTEEQKVPADSTPPQAAPVGGLVAFVGSLRFALVVVVLIVAACLAGTLLPQGSQVLEYVEKNPAAVRRMEVLTVLGLTRVFSCWWFALLLGALAASLAVCTWRRVMFATRVAGDRKTRVVGSVVTHVSMLLILCGGVISALWGERGVMELRVGESSASFRAGAGAIVLPFKIRLVDFKVEMYGRGDKGYVAARKGVPGKIVVRWRDRQLACELPADPGTPHNLLARDGAPDDFVVTVKRYVPDFVIDSKTREVRSRSEQDDNPAVLVSVAGAGATNDVWLFAKFPEFNTHGGQVDGTSSNAPELMYRFEQAPMRARRGGGIKDFISRVQVLENDAVVREATIEVNGPLTWKGYRIYQAGYNPEDRDWTSFQVVRDPGVGVVFLGFALMIAGMTVVFYINPLLASRAAKTEGAK